MCESNPAREAQRALAIERLAASHAEQFVEFCEGDPRVMDALMEICSDFMDEMLPIVDEDAKYDVGLALLGRVYLKAMKNM